MSLSVRSAEIYLSNWFSRRTKRIQSYARPAAKKTLTGFYPHFLRGHTAPQRTPAGFHRPAQSLHQEDSLELNPHSRGLCDFSGLQFLLQKI